MNYRTGVCHKHPYQTLRQARGAINLIQSRNGGRRGFKYNLPPVEDAR